MNVPNLYLDMISQTHVLLAGATGSGKSVAVNGMIYAALMKHGAAAQLILIDPKRVELADWSRTANCIRYACEPWDCLSALQDAVTIIEQRYQYLARIRQKKLTGQPVYVVIDELADLMTTQKRAVLPLLQRICQIGRAADVHVIAATQCPLRTIIPTEIKVNFDYRLGLRMAQAQHSRNLLDETGCEMLPRYGEGLYQTPEGTTKYKVPMVPDEDIETVIRLFSKSWLTRRRARKAYKAAQRAAVQAPALQAGSPAQVCGRTRTPEHSALRAMPHTTLRSAN